MANNFLKYYKAYKDKIYNYFWYRVNFDRPLAEDLTAEVFLKALENFSGFDQNRPFQPWIFTLARNHLINYYRRAKREVPLGNCENLNRDELPKIQARLEVERIIKKIKQLEPYHQEVLLLKYVDGLANGEIALVLEKEEGAVRTQLSRALNQLRETLSYE